jgi:hypothetical protein
VNLPPFLKAEAVEHSGVNAKAFGKKFDLQVHALAEKGLAFGPLPECSRFHTPPYSNAASGGTKGSPNGEEPSLSPSDALLKGERIPRRAADRGVVEDAPHGTIASQAGQLLGEPLDVVGAVFRIIDARGPMQPKVSEACVPRTSSVLIT